MPWDEVMHKWKHGLLHSGSKTGKKVTNRKQAIAIMLSEKKAASNGKREYGGISPSRKVVDDMLRRKQRS